MLEELRITSLGVIEETVLDLGPGLTVLTGETGAGKTMVVTAVGLLLGGRGDSGAVRAGARQCRIEGTFAGPTELIAAVEAAGGETEDGRVLCARTVAAEGRSRGYVGGAAVPTGRLAGMLGPAVAVHGQSDQHRLLRPAAQQEALDCFGGPDLAGRLRHYQEVHAELLAVEAELAEVVAGARERAQERDLLSFGLAEIDSVAPSAGEDAELAAEEQRLAHADGLRTAAETAREALSGDTEQPDALSLAAAARRSLDGVREYDARAGDLADRLTELGYLLSDLAADVASYATGIETDPVRLAAVSERRAAVTALTRKYGDTLDEVLQWARHGAERLAHLDGAGDRTETLRSRAKALRAELATAGAELSAQRAAAAGRLATLVTAELAGLAMPHARLEIAVDRRAGTPDHPRTVQVDGAPVRFGPAGIDEIEFRLAANTDAPARPLARSASGGELSRLMLAIEVVLAGTSPAPTFVFDEVDAGVGGKAAVEIGLRLARLARTAQVLVVTHLAQVAAYADRHVVVTKADDGTVTRSSLQVLTEAEQVRELARMLAGQEDSDSALAHARELLQLARATR